MWGSFDEVCQINNATQPPFFMKHYATSIGPLTQRLLCICAKNIAQVDLRIYFKKFAANVFCAMRTMFLVLMFSVFLIVCLCVFVLVSLRFNE